MTRDLLKLTTTRNLDYLTLCSACLLFKAYETYTISLCVARVYFSKRVYCLKNFSAEVHALENKCKNY